MTKLTPFSFDGSLNCWCPFVITFVLVLSQSLQTALLACKTGCLQFYGQSACKRAHSGSCVSRDCAFNTLLGGRPIQKPRRLVTRYQSLFQLVIFLLFLYSFEILKQRVYGEVCHFLSPFPKILFCLFQVIHGLLDRTMQLLEVPYSEDKTSVHGYHLKAHEGINNICAPFNV